MRFNYDSPQVENAKKFYIKRTNFFNEKAFIEDFKLFFSIKILIKKFLKTGEINDKLLINKVIILSNNFKKEFVIEKFKEILSLQELTVIKSILVFLSLQHQDLDVVEENRVFSDIINDIKHRYYIL